MARFNWQDLGPFVDDATCETFIVAMNWDLAGNPRAGMRYFNTTFNWDRQWDGAMWRDVGGGTPANTLDDAYNEGGAGAGRTINANAGSVQINRSGGSAFSLELSGSADLLSINNGAGIETAYSANSIVIDGANSIYRTGSVTGGNSYDVQIYSGYTFVSGDSGAVEIDTGDAAGDSGGVTISTGAGVNSGDITLEVGSGSVTNGDILIGCTGVAPVNIMIGAWATPVTIGSNFLRGYGAGLGLQIGHPGTGGPGTGSCPLIVNMTTAQRNDLIAAPGMIVYVTDAAPPEFQVYENGAWVAITAAGSGNTLDQAYDQGGAGIGRIIDVDAGSVFLDAQAGYTAGMILEIKSGSTLTGDMRGASIDLSGVTPSGNAAIGLDVLVPSGETAIKLQEDNFIEFEGAAGTNTIQLTTGANPKLAFSGTAVGPYDIELDMDLVFSTQDSYDIGIYSESPALGYRPRAVYSYQKFEVGANTTLCSVLGPSGLLFKGVAAVVDTDNVTSGASGALTINTGDSTGGGTLSGDLTLTTGDAGTTAGDIHMDPGLKGSGSQGTIYIGESNSGAVYIGNASASTSQLERIVLAPDDNKSVHFQKYSPSASDEEEPWWLVERKAATPWNLGFYTYPGDPNGNITAGKGSLCVDRTTSPPGLYQNTTGLSVWTKFNGGGGVDRYLIFNDDNYFAEGGTAYQTKKQFRIIIDSDKRPDEWRVVCSLWKDAAVTSADCRVTIGADNVVIQGTQNAENEEAGDITLTGGTSSDTLYTATIDLKRNGGSGGDFVYLQYTDVYAVYT